MVEEVDSDDADIVMPELDEIDCNKFLEVQKIIKGHYIIIILKCLCLEKWMNSNWISIMYAIWF